jgi:Abortive infection bacteriophage resistance protein
MNRVPYNKSALTYAEQLQQLKDRGLSIDNETKALHLLEVISYYRLSGYWYPLLADKQNHRFKPNATFDTAFSIYKFDRELRLLVLRELEKIEIAVRAKMIYVLSQSLGPFWYLDSANFYNPVKHADTLSKIGNEYSRSDEEFLQAFKNKYIDSMPPSWMMLEISSFGTLSSLYSYLKPTRDKREIAKYFGLADKVFSSWLHSIVYLRNICAHHARLWNREMQIQPIIPRNTHYPFINQISYISPETGRSTPLNNKTYFILSMVIYLMNTINRKHTIQNKFKALLAKYPNIDPRAMGFPSTWQNEPLWK